MVSVVSVGVGGRGKRVGLCGKEGKLVVVEVRERRVMAAFESYYGGFLCCSFNESEELLVGASEDDLLSLYSLSSSPPSLLYRLTGHSSFPSHLHFSSPLLFLPLSSSSSSSSSSSPFPSVTLLSIGEDGKLLLWEFLVEATLSTGGEESEREEKEGVRVERKKKEEVGVVMVSESISLSNNSLSSLFLPPPSPSYSPFFITCDVSSNLKLWIRKDPI